MDVAGPFPIGEPVLSDGGMLDCFPIPYQKATTVTRKLVYEIVPGMGQFRSYTATKAHILGPKKCLESAGCSASTSRGLPRTIPGVTDSSSAVSGHCVDASKQRAGTLDKNGTSLCHSY